MLDFAIELAHRAGALLRAGQDRPYRVELKSPFEVVTDIDRASETLIVSTIAQQFPDHTVLAEEGGGFTRDSEYLWLVDPLDGTNNYAHGFPMFAVSLALLKGEMLWLGVVYDPIRNELFAAEQGKGAYCNGRRIHVSQTATMAAALVSTGFPYTYATHPDNNARQFVHVHAHVQGVRRSGSAALDLAYVGSGRLDAHWELGLKPWDSGAGALLVVEAGGCISDWRGGSWSPWSDRLVATNAIIHKELISALDGAN